VAQPAPDDLEHRQAGDVLAVEQDAAGGAQRRAAHGHQQRGLAGAVGADQRHDLAGLDLEVDAAQRLDAPVAGEQALDRQHQPFLLVRAMASSSGVPR
jgi:hypothetical protein